MGHGINVNKSFKVMFLRPVRFFIQCESCGPLSVGQGGGGGKMIWILCGHRGRGVKISLFCVDVFYGQPLRALQVSENLRIHLLFN